MIVAAVAAVVITANIREGRRSPRPFTALPAFGAPGAPAASREGLDKRIADMEGKLAADSGDVGAAVLLADALIRQSRVTGNAGLVMRAERALKSVLREDPGNYDALRMQGSVYLSQHRFAEAAAVGEQCRALRPADPVNYGVIGDAQLELGNYDEAFAAFEQMMQRRPGPASYARMAYAMEIKGQLNDALEAMKLAAGASEGGDREAMAWYRAQVGDLYLRLERPSDAMREFATASQAFPGHPFAVTGYAKAIAQLGKTDEARALLEDLAKRAPTPDLYALLGDMSARAGRAVETARYYALAEAAWRSDAPEPKNLARFLADRGERIDEAVRIAEAAANERHDIFTHDALAWAYFKAGRTTDAKRTIQLALRTGTRDAEILRHARAIQDAPQQVARR